MATAKGLINKIKIIDQLGKEVGFTFDGHSTYRTYLGVIVTIVMFIMTLTYSVKCLSIVSSHTGSTHGQFDHLTTYTLEEPLQQADSQVNFMFNVFE